MENEGRTALWPIYVDKETGKIIDTVTNMMRPIDPHSVEICKDMCKDVESNALRTLMIESTLTFNTGIIKNNTDFILIAQDANTQEIIDFVNPSNQIDNNERMSRLIRLAENVAMANDGSGNANLFMTVISNVVARYCALSEENQKSFNEVVNFWKGKN